MNNIVRRIEDFFVRNRDRFGYIHLAMLIVFLALMIIPPFLPLPPEDAAIRNNFTLMTKFLIWGLWFPLMLLSVVFLGRLWCGLLCPQGALSEFAGKRGLNRPIPRWMRREWMPIASFIFVTTLAQLVGARDYPLAALEILGGTMLLAAIVGFLYASGRRSWCRYLCPVGPLLGIFSRLGAVSFEKNGGDGRGCICPTFINTANKVASSNCIECFRCVHADDKASLHLKIRHPGLEIEEIKRREPNLWEVIFLFAATGLALGAFHWQVNPMYIRYKQMLGGLLLNLGLGDFIGRSGPWWIMVNHPSAGDVFNRLDFISIATFMLASMAGIAIILFMLTAISAFILKEKEPVMATVARLGYLYAPVALVSLVLGLGLILFQSLGDLGLQRGTVKMIQGVFFLGGGVWSFYLALKLHGAWNPAMIPSILGIGFVALAWYKVLF
ncbi:MAG: 4Fe-4S binding protein [Deltaproteobacteria bacterium]|nr:4Fe-4S binding protein [Deltaproteobacteria bacterium]